MIYAGHYYLLIFLTYNALIHSFRANKDLFISAPSANLLLLLLWVSVALSLSAKSTNDSFAYSSSSFFPSVLIIKLQISLDLEDVSLVAVLCSVHILLRNLLYPAFLLG